MSEEYGPNFVTLTDEEGNDIELEYIDAGTLAQSVYERRLVKELGGEEE